MTMLDDTIEDVAGRFGLGSKTRPLMTEITQLMTGSPGGIGGFIDKFRSAGLGSKSPRGSAEPMEPRSRGRRWRKRLAALRSAESRAGSASRAVLSGRR